MNEQIKVIHNKAISYYKKKEFDQAILLLQKALEVNPQEIEVLYSLGIINFELKKFDESINFLQKLVDLSPGHYKAMLILGTAFIKKRNFDQAEEYIQKSIEINPEQKLAYINLGAIYSVQKHFTQGIEMFKKVVDDYPDEVRSYLGLAKIYAILDKTDKANDYFKKVIELDSNGSLGKYAKKALIVNENSVKDDGDLEQIYGVGYKYLLTGFYLDAIKKFETYLESRPKDDLVNFLMAQSLMRTGMLERSFLFFKRAILLNPQNGLYYKELAILLDKYGKPNDVIKILLKAIEFGKEDSLIHYLMGKNYIQSGQKEKGIKSLKKANKLDKNNLIARLELAKVYMNNNNAELGQNILQYILDHPLDNLLKEEAEELMSKNVSLRKERR